MFFLREDSSTLLASGSGSTVVSAIDSLDMSTALHDVQIFELKQALGCIMDLLEEEEQFPSYKIQDIRSRFGIY